MGKFELFFTNGPNLFTTTRLEVKKHYSKGTDKGIFLENSDCIPRGVQRKYFISKARFGHFGQQFVFNKYSKPYHLRMCQQLFEYDYCIL